MSFFSVGNETKIIEIEHFLNNNAYLSENLVPGAADAQILEEIEENGMVPDPDKYPL